jgi:type I restriction enzyme, S subunit
MERLGSLCDIAIGRTPSRARSEYWGPGAPWLSVADMNQGRDLVTTTETITDRALQDARYQQVVPGTVLLSFKLSIGKVGIARTRMYTNEAIAHLPIRDESRIRADYLYWALKTTDLMPGADRAAMGATLNMAKLREIRIPLPPTKDQQSITEILDRVDTLMAKRRAALAQFDELVQAIFLDLFGDPVRNLPGWPTLRLQDTLSMPLRNGLSPSHAGKVKAKVLTLSAVTGSEFDASPDFSVVRPTAP